jgi:hypothetical protein
VKQLRRPDEHARFRALLALQLDEPLPLDDAWALNVHLSRCEGCRAAERDFLEQRRLLRGLASLSPPRDLGARTSAALDREVLHHPPRSSSGLWPARKSVGGPGVGATSVVVSLAVLMVGGMAVLSGLPSPRPDPTRLRPTPLAVPGQALAYLGAGPDGLAVYRTSVDQVCPLSAIDCVDQSDEDAPLLALSRQMQPSSLALSPTGERLAISARDSQTEEDVFAIVLMPPTTTPPPAPAPSVTVAVDPIDPTPASVAPASAPVPTDPPLTGPPAADTPDPMISPDPAPPDLTSGGETPVPTSALMLVAILEDVRGAGAAPAWSPDSSMLAFSAMPVDGSHGPDLYLWRPGDEAARPVTSDHATYFASWSGPWIVVSRVRAEAAATEPQDAQPAVRPAPLADTLLIDPATGLTTALDGPSLWLPQVNGPRSHAVAWQGTLAWSGNTVQPAEGALYLLDWRPLDPFAGTDTNGDGTTPSPTPTESLVTEPAASPSGEPGAPQPGVVPDPSRSPAQPGSSASPSPTARSSPVLTLPPIGSGVPSNKPRPSAAASSPPATSPAPDESVDPSATESAPPAASPSDPLGTAPSPAAAALLPLEPARDAEAQPVLDWEVRWAPDGSAVGFWIADVPGASWGRLAVVPLDAATGQLGLNTPLLPPTLARRSFTLGHNRVAWVGPAESTPDGELRISVWGPGGSGVLRFTAPELHGVLAAF